MNKSDIINHYHCCATCVNFSVKKENGRQTAYCTRLGYNTSPKYVFNCWEPKPRVVEAIKKMLAQQ